MWKYLKGVPLPKKRKADDDYQSKNKKNTTVQQG